MEQFKKTAKKLFYKPYGLTVLISVPSFLFVAYVLMSGIERSIYAAIAYALSSYSLILSGTAAYRIIIVIKEKITSHHLWKRYCTDFVFRTKVSLIPTIIINVVFAMLKLVMGIHYHSVWMIALGIYYVSLLRLRVTLLRNVYHYSFAEEKKNEMKVANRYGFYLVLLDIALGGIVLYSILWGAKYSYPGHLIYAMAAYTFYAVIGAAIGFFKNYRNDSALILTLNILKLTTALVALFALETAMLHTFGEESSRIFRQYTITITGFALVAIILGMALYLMIHFQRESNKTLITQEE